MRPSRIYAAIDSSVVGSSKEAVTNADVVQSSVVKPPCITKEQAWKHRQVDETDNDIVQKICPQTTQVFNAAAATHDKNLTCGDAHVVIHAQHSHQLDSHLLI
jgi:hypothetical protein